MKKISKLATAALAGVMGLCSMTSVSASAANTYRKFYHYQAANGETFTYSKNYIFYGDCKGELPGNTSITVKYRKATDDFTIVSYKKANCGDVNLDGQITKDDAELALDIACMKLSGIDPAQCYNEKQLCAARVTDLFDKTSHWYEVGSSGNSILDAQLIITYVNNKSKYTSMEDCVMKAYAGAKNFRVDTRIDVYSSTQHCLIPLIINVNCQNTERGSYTNSKGTTEYVYVR